MTERERQKTHAKERLHKYWENKNRKQTNADKIRSMTDEELAAEMSDRLSEDCLMCPVLEADCPVWESKDIECKDAMLEWLRAEVSE